MRIAFDVKGTIEGPKKQQVLHMFKAFQEAGHEVVVWSNSIFYAQSAVENNDLKVEYMDKRMKGDYDFDESLFFDIAIEDDRSQTWLAAKKFLFVDEIPVNMGDVDLLIKELLIGNVG